MPLRKISIKSSQPKTMTTAATSDLKDELLKWICERHATNGPLDRQLLRDKALQLATSLGITGFKCSEAWLTVFLKKHGFSPSLTNCSGPTFPDYRVWIDLLRSLITQYRHKDLFNVDELVMYSDFVPPRISSPTLQHENQHGDSVKKTRENSFDLSSDTTRIGMLMCCNSSGTEKLRPLISGPYELENPRKDCHYHREEDSSITDDLFGEWLAKLNEEMSKSSRKILLLLSRDRIRALQNAPVLSHVNLLFFPKDFPAQLRPLRGDVFHCVKMMYRIRYVEHIQTAKKEWGPEEIVESIVRAWKEVPQELVVSSFQRTKFREDESFLKIECPAWENLETGISFRRFVTFDDDLSESSSHIPDDLKFLSGNKHQYNLRRSRHDTSDLEVIEEINSMNALRGRKAPKRRSVDQTTKNRPEASSDYESPGSSGLKKKRKMTEELTAENQEDQQESQTSHTSDSMSSNDETRDRSLVERIEDFLENVIDPTVEEDNPVSNLVLEASSTNKNHENMDNFLNEICLRSDKSRRLMEHCLRTISIGSCVGKFTDEDNRGDSRSSERDSIEEVDSRRDDIEERGELVDNFPGEAGPSRKEIVVNDETSGYENPPIITEFDDEDEPIPIAGQLQLKIIEAIEYCDEIESSNAEHIDLGEAGDDNNPRTSKRTRNYSENDDNDEPAEKRARPDGSWSKRYETNFVFGPDLHESSNQSVESSVATDQPLQNHLEPVTKSKKTQTRSSELEKRCIFTLDGKSPGVSFPASKD